MNSNLPVTAGGRARLFSARRSRNQTARSVWSAWSLLPLSDVWRGSKAGASSTHSIRFAKHDRPPAPPVQLVPCSPGNLRKKTTISDIVIQRAGLRSGVYGGALNNMDESPSFSRGFYSSQINTERREEYRDPRSVSSLCSSRLCG